MENEIQLEMQEFFLHPEGTFDATLSDFIPKEGQFGRRIQWVFQTDILKPDGTPAQLAYWTGSKFGTKTKLTEFITSLGLQAPRKKEDLPHFRLSDLRGVRARISVIHEENEQGTWANIIKVRPMPPEIGTVPARPPSLLEWEEEGLDREAQLEQLLSAGKVTEEQVKQAIWDTQFPGKVKATPADWEKLYTQVKGD